MVDFNEVLFLADVLMEEYVKSEVIEGDVVEDERSRMYCGLFVDLEDLVTMETDDFVAMFVRPAIMAMATEMNIYAKSIVKKVPLLEPNQHYLETIPVRVVIPNRDTEPAIIFDIFHRGEN